MMKSYYLFGSRLATHVIFWISYYLLFGFIWADNGNYLASYFLEFVLLPIRIFAVYITLYFLIPRFLQKRYLLSFAIGYLTLLLVSGIGQRVFTFLFYEGVIVEPVAGLFVWKEIMRSVILINSTVLFVSALKIIKLWFHEQDKNLSLSTSMDNQNSSQTIPIKAENRTYRVAAEEILFVEGLGNYVVFVLNDHKIISYISLKEAENLLPGSFQRIHKSYIVNKKRITSYNYEDVQINDHFIPIGRSYKSELNI